MFSRRFVIGDIHGAYRPLMECFEKASFNYEKDLLISLGDVCDGWPQVKDVIEELLKIKNFVMVIGNHDDYTLNWFNTGEKRREWLQQGGTATLASYAQGVPESHKEFLRKAKNYFVLDFKMFVHGGFDPSIDISEQDKEVLMWDRSLVELAMQEDGSNKKLTSFDEVYLGHTPTLKLGLYKPSKLSEIWLMDTGAGWSQGRVSMMDIDTNEYYQSGIVQGYYPFFKGRG